MSAACLPQEVHIGFVELKGAHRFPLSEVFVTLSANEISFTLKGDTEAPWADRSLVSITMFRLPKGRSEFNEQVAWFSEGRKKRVRLPEGDEFNPSMLAVRNAPISWIHDGFARSGHDFIHTYESDRHAMLIRYMSRAGTMLDHPLLRPVHKNLRILEDE
jgi:hypothetical protein